MGDPIPLPIPLDDGLADFISLGRPLIAEPDLVNRWASGDRERAFCISCNRCYKPLQAGSGVACPLQLEK
jgi:2,4-dienoyl-CoA reductase-like NADH-dependent reductase (Old Yellow Enzyme family)